jgi:hypothetical protein
MAIPFNTGGDKLRYLIHVEHMIGPVAKEHSSGNRSVRRQRIKAAKAA